MMRRLFAVLVLLIVPAELAAQVSFVQIRDSQPGDQSSIAIPVTATTGHGLLLFVGSGSASMQGMTFSDGTNTYTHGDSIGIAGGGGQVWEAYNCNITGGSLTITFTPGAGTINQVAVVEVSGQKTSACLDRHADSTATSAAPSVRLLTTTAADFVGGFVMCAGSCGAVSPGSGFTNQYEKDNWGALEELVQGAAGNTTPSFSMTSVPWPMLAITILPASGGGGSGGGGAFRGSAGTGCREPLPD